MKYNLHLPKSKEPEVIGMLKEASLPFSDIDLDRQHFIGLFQNESLAGVGALEYYNTHALLRSLAVDSSLRGQGFGVLLLESLIKIAKEKQTTQLILLTETAEHFFRKFGFVVINRSDVPADIKSSKEFSVLCPDTAVCMSLNIKK